MKNIKTNLGLFSTLSKNYDHIEPNMISIL